MFSAAAGFNEALEVIKAVLASLFADPRAQFLAGHIGLNVGLAVLSAFRRGTFTFARLFSFLGDKLLPNLFTFLVAELAGESLGFAGLATIVWLGLQSMLLAASIESLTELGIPVPDVLARWSAKPGALPPRIGD